MKFSPESPELTAYALGELPEPMRSALETQLAADPALQAELAALRTTAQQLRTELAAEPQPELAPVQRAWIAGRLDQVAAQQRGASSPRGRRTFPWWWVLCSGATAAVVTALTMRSLVWTDSNLGRPRETSPLVSRSTSADTITPVPLTQSPEAPPPPAAVAAKTLSTQPVDAPPPTPVRIITANADSLRSDAYRIAETPVTAAGRSPSPISADRAESILPSSKIVPTKPTPTTTPTLPPAISPSSSVSPRSGISASSLEVRPRARLEVESRGSGSAGLGGSALDKSLSYAAPDSGIATVPNSRLPRVEPELARRYLQPRGESSTERYAPIVENPFRPVDQAPLSTFGMDVDTASYANARRFLREGSLPPPDAVRLEEFINYFPYDLPSAKGSDPFGVVVEIAECPWNQAHRLVRVGLRARDLPRGERPHANLVFLVDVSGSMQPENKLPLVKKSLRLLVDQLTPRDTVALVTYAGEAGVALNPTSGSEKSKIIEAIDRLAAGGSTHGSAGIQTAYDLARKSFVKEGVNRVLLCTDGDFNVGTTSHEGLLALITEQARSGVFLSVLGYGMGNYQDATTELLADKGNGNYAYIDSFSEARKVLREQLQATLVTVAKDAKIQIEFNPAKVASWRLLGYENRVLADRDFKDDQKDAGDVGAGQSVTALYELVPAGPQLAGAGPLRYQRPAEASSPDRSAAGIKTGMAEFRDELLFLKVRHKLPDAATSTEWTVAVKDDDRAWSRASDDFQFSAAVAGFGLRLRNSAHGGAVSYELIQRLAQEGLGSDRDGYRAEFIDLVRQAQRLSGQGGGIRP